MVKFHGDRRSDGGLGKDPVEFMAFVADLSTRFIHLPPDEIHLEIEHALRLVCNRLDMDMAALWQSTGATDPDLALSFYYSRQDDSTVVPQIGASGQELFPWCYQQMLTGRSVSTSSPEELPEAAAVDRESMRTFGVTSQLTSPLVVGEKALVGVLGFGTSGRPCDWPDELVAALELVAQVFANALARKASSEALGQSEERLAMAVDAAEAGIWTLAFGSGEYWATDRARQIFGYPPDVPVTVESHRERIHPEDRDFVDASIENAVRTGRSVRVRFRILLGTERQVRWVSSLGRIHFSPAGEPEMLAGMTIDITEQMHVEEALRTSESRLSAAAELAGLASYELDFENGRAFVDKRYRDICGIPPEVDQGMQPLAYWMEHLHPDDAERVTDLRHQLYEGRLPRLFVEYRYLHPTRGSRWMQHEARVSRRDAAGRAVMAYGVILDITERKRIDEELHDLSRRLIGAQEEDRALLARELHDDISQRLAVLAIEAGRAEQATPDEAPTEALRAIREGLTTVSDDIHSLAYQLHPSVLEELGLVEALQAECERRDRQSGIDISLDLHPVPAVLGGDEALCVFRVAQEALSNVVGHADARSAMLTLRQMGDGLLLAVSDSGVGFDLDSPGRKRSLGLASMRERIRLVNGTLDIESAPGHGTTVVAWVPAGGQSP
jgi:PAS domain S-box-containing protein